jgi:hypothetical protein
MGRSKRTPERSQIARTPVTAFAKRQRSSGEGSGDDDGDDDDDKPAVPRTMTQQQPAEQKSAAQADAPKADDAPKAGEKDLPEIQPPDPKGEPWPDATPAPMKPVEPARAKTETVAIPASVDLGRPPEMPTTSAPPPLTLGAVENPAHMPGPREIPAGEPNDPAPAPGTVPPGDSRSLRRGNEFALVYRVQTFVISRFGVIGTRGQWRVVEYPTSGAAGNAYAREASRFVSEGFSDYRE